MMKLKDLNYDYSMLSANKTVIILHGNAGVFVCNFVIRFIYQNVPHHDMELSIN